MFDCAFRAANGIRAMEGTFELGEYIILVFCVAIGSVAMLAAGFAYELDPRYAFFAMAGLSLGGGIGALLLARRQRTGCAAVVDP